LAVRQFRQEIHFPSHADRLDPGANGLVISNAPVLQPRMGCFMHNGGCNVFKGGGFREDETFIKHACVQRGLVAADRAWHYVYQDALKVVDDAGIVQRSVLLDQAERVVDALQAGAGLLFRAPDPKSINVSAGRQQPEVKPVYESWPCRLFR